MAGYCSRHTRVFRFVSEEQAPAFLKINLLFWSGGVIGTERLPARIYSLESNGAKRAASSQLGRTRNRLLGVWAVSPSLNLDSPIPACISLHSLMLGALYLEISHSPCWSGRKRAPKGSRKRDLYKGGQRLSYNNIMCLKELTSFQVGVLLFTHFIGRLNFLWLEVYLLR